MALRTWLAPDRKSHAAVSDAFSSPVCNRKGDNKMTDLEREERMDSLLALLNW